MTNAKQFQPPTEQEIAVYAYHLWETEGRVQGRDLDYWIQAKAHLIADREYEAGLLKNTEENISPAETRKIPAPAASSSKPSKKRRAAREPAYA